jgi:hypothetical protein
VPPSQQTAALVPQSAVGGALSESPDASGAGPEASGLASEGSGVGLNGSGVGPIASVDGML